MAAKTLEASSVAKSFLRRDKLSEIDGKVTKWWEDIKIVMHLGYWQLGRERADVDFCSIMIDGSPDTDLMKQRLHGIATQRDELQQMEIELRAQMIARSDIIEMRNSFSAQIKEHANITTKLQEQLNEREQVLHGLERKMEEKERELHAIKLDSEVAWAKEDLLREQNKELATFRRELDHSEAERAQHIQQVHELQEHVQEKERQLIDLQEQHRVAQETIMYKDEQLREAQAWIARVQEMDALQSTANHTLQAELRERTEQYNQLWLGCQRQFVEMERLHVHNMQQLQLELADARERKGTYNHKAHISQSNSKDVSQFNHINGNNLDTNGSAASNTYDGGISNEIPDNTSSLPSTGNGSTQNGHASGVPMMSSSLLGIPTYLPSGQTTGLHSYVMHQQEVPHSFPAHAFQSDSGQFQSATPVSSLQQWQNQQAVSEGSQISTQHQLASAEIDQDPGRPDMKYDAEGSVDGQALSSGYVDVHINQRVQFESASALEPQTREPIDRSHLVIPRTEESLQQISSKFRDALRLDIGEQNTNSELKEQNIFNAANDAEVQQVESGSAATGTTPSIPSIESWNLNEALVKDGTGSVIAAVVHSKGKTDMLRAEKILEPALLDEQSLLACIVRTIPPGARIHIRSTLPNRLGKMLSPLHWHHYKKRHGAIDDFVASHPDLFLIVGDYIQLREGAQEVIAANAAAAKVAAAAAASSPYSSHLPSVAVTPMAQSRMKKVHTIDSKHVNYGKTGFKEYAVDPPTSAHNYPHHLNGVSFDVSRVKILSKSKDSPQMNGPYVDRSDASNTQSNGSNHVRPNTNFVGQQQRRNVPGSYSRR